MVFGLYVMYDRVAQEAGPVWMAKNDGVAGRQFVQMLSKEGVRAEEFDLLEVGKYTTDPVSVEGINPPRSVEISLYKEVLDGPASAS